MTSGTPRSCSRDAKLWRWSWKAGHHSVLSFSTFRVRPVSASLSSAMTFFVFFRPTPDWVRASVHSRRKADRRSGARYGSPAVPAFFDPRRTLFLPWNTSSFTQSPASSSDRAVLASGSSARSSRSTRSARPVMGTVRRPASDFG